ncbi:4Fe-4S dicluster domain-containing protein [Bilophila wadsworthia]|uniref:4Fe-4S dicluster domain-containing protein n=1 Tax=Bilophila wadsworthia TaxID=35833 RepID=UPI000D78D1E8|nr:MAG: ferredoxin [Desulfovibrionaceae bacterium]
MPPIIDPEKCKGCGTCAQICPVQVFRFHRAEEKTPRPVFGEECWHCNCCVEDCPAGAIRLRVPVPYMMVHVDADTLKPARSRHDGN